MPDLFRSNPVPDLSSAIANPRMQACPTNYLALVGRKYSIDVILAQIELAAESPQALHLGLQLLGFGFDPWHPGT